jgi:hypothetical protein
LEAGVAELLALFSLLSAAGGEEVEDEAEAASFFGSSLGASRLAMSSPSSARSAIKEPT